tara:strand:+ start:333 stop:548 length:216 start_codon:yes stop_codon:yes gene_type:complete
MKIEITSAIDASLNGYVSLTTPYDQSKEHEVQWMKNVINDMRGCSIVLIETNMGYEVARHKSEIIPPGSSK